ncbi:MAG: DHH family phosphoesterase [Thermoplasmatales archaeon]|nr:MAG: DHH family phosphoesterase [Thermoplasmatales archaeon]
MTDKLNKTYKKAIEIILSIPKDTRIRVISHYDADGISAAAIICKALYHAGYDFHSTLMRNPFDKGLTRVSKEENQLIIFLDMGSGQIETIEKMNCKSIIVDHHQYLKEKPAKHVFQINANLCGINGNYEACGASLTYGLCKALNHDNSNLVSLAITGIMGDKQYIGGIRGYNKSIIDEALKNNLITEKVGIKFYGESIFDALYYSVDPYFSGVSGNKEVINDLLDKFKINTDTKCENLSENQMSQLQSYLMFLLVKKGCEKNILDTIIRQRYYSTNIYGCELERFADLLDSCGKSGNRGLGLSSAIGDNKSFNEAVKLEKEYKQKILDELIRLENDGFIEKKGFKYFYSIDSSLGGVIGGIATNFILDSEKPLMSIVKKDDEIHVSCRGNQQLVKQGLDLGFAMKKSSEKLGGHGGGHAIASGATIQASKEEEFLKIVDEIIINQLK